MRLAIISDIHSNLQALTTAFGLIAIEGVDEIVCLGDVVGYGANPNECIDLVRNRCSVVLLGNHDNAAVDPEAAESFTERARRAIYWTREQLTDENMDFLEALPYVETRKEALFVHASPCHPEWWEYVLTASDAHACFDCFEQSLCFLGHTHTPVLYSPAGRRTGIVRDERYIINVGSIGQPRDGNPDLSFGILDTERWEYRNIRAPYDIKEAAERILKAGLPRALADRLFAGI